MQAVFDETFLESPPPPSHRGSPTWEMAYFFPPQGSWAEEDYLSLGTAWMIEFEDGCIEVLPMPTVAHQRIVDYLAAELKAYFKRIRIGGDVLTAPLPIRLRAGKFREPDVVYLRPGRIVRPDEQPDGADLVMEVVSDGDRNRERDLQTKRSEYAAAGIDEYWIVDPQTRTITVLVAQDGVYRIHAECRAGEVATSATFAGFQLDVSTVLAAAQRSTLDD